MKNILMIIHTFPPMGSVGGSIRIVKFLKYINEITKDISVTLITIRDDIVPLNDLHLSKALLSELSDININIIRTNTLQPRHPNPSQYGFKKNEINQNKNCYRNLIKNVLKKAYNFSEKYILIPDYALLWAPFLIPKAIKESKNIDLIYATAPPIQLLYRQH